MALQHVDLGKVAATPWKNGGGTTRELACSPRGADMAQLDWRVSVATIAQSGPFSCFAGVDRIITLLSGDGVHLTQASTGIDHRLQAPLQPFAFAGDAGMDCELLGGPSTDFNVMTRRATLQAQVHVLDSACTLAPQDRGLLLVVRGAWTLQGEDGTTQCAAEQGVWWDGEPRAWQLKPAGDAPALLWVNLYKTSP